jgi:hypothetical protein
MIEEAYEIDKKTGTEHWHNAMVKAMKNNMCQWGHIASLFT